MKKLGGYAVLAAAGMAVTACAALGEQVEIRQAIPKSERVLGLSVAVCGAQLESSVEETPAEVVVTVTAIGASEADCAQGLDVELEEPLAGRAVVDGSTGQVVELDDAPHPS